MDYRRKKGDKKKKKGDGGRRPFPTFNSGREVIRPMNVSQTVIEGLPHDIQVGTIIVDDWFLVGDPASKHILITPDDGLLIRKAEVGKIWLDDDGDVFIGSDISDPATTNIAIFGKSQPYNGESFQTGDLLLGDNSEEKANIFWDKSAGILYFRSGETANVFIDTDGSVNVRPNSTSVDLHDPNAYLFKSGGDAVSGIYANLLGNPVAGYSNTITMKAHATDGRSSSVYLAADGDDGEPGFVSFEAYSGSGLGAEIGISAPAGGGGIITIKVDDTGQITLDPGTGSSELLFKHLPTSDPVVADQVWNDSGTLKISAG